MGNLEENFLIEKTRDFKDWYKTLTKTQTPNTPKELSLTISKTMV